MPLTLAAGASAAAHYFSIGAFGLDVKTQPDPTVPDPNHFTDVAFDAVYQYNGGGAGAVLAHASYIHEKQDLTAAFNAGGSDNQTNHLNVFTLDASYAYSQTWSAGAGVFDSGASRSCRYRCSNSSAVTKPSMRTHGLSGVTRTNVTGV